MSTSQLMLSIEPRNKMLHVAVGVIWQEGKILLAKRHAGQHQGGLWEFPGGKVEQGESVEEALNRELTEEIGIGVGTASPLIQIPYHYPDRSVLLDVWHVHGFSGSVEPREGQPLEWVVPSCLEQYDLPAANKPIIDAINLPSAIAITGHVDSVIDLEKRILVAKQRGADQILVRSTIDLGLSSLSMDSISMLDRTCPNWILHCRSMDMLPKELRLFPRIHLNAGQLSKWTERPPHLTMLGASCHNSKELKQAVELGCNYAFLSPFRFTKSHPGQPPLGPDTFKEMVAGVPIPVYALGGLSYSDVSEVQHLGAQGVAAIGAFWGEG